jgi:hypothetical protein
MAKVHPAIIQDMINKGLDLSSPHNALDLDGMLSASVVEQNIPQIVIEASPSETLAVIEEIQPVAEETPVVEELSVVEEASPAVVEQILETVEKESTDSIVEQSQQTPEIEEEITTTKKSRKHKS